jgi:hypothetical protein
VESALAEVRRLFGAAPGSDDGFDLLDSEHGAEFTLLDDPLT